MKRLAVIFGLPGSGKTVVSDIIADRLGWLRYDMDSAIPENVKSRIQEGGINTEKERDETINKMISDVEKLLEKNSVVLSCSLIKEKHRRLVKSRIPASILVHLDVRQKELEKRLDERKGHFFGAVSLRKLVKEAEPISIFHFSVNAERKPALVADEIEKIIEKPPKGDSRRISAP